MRSEQEQGEEGPPHGESQPEEPRESLSLPPPEAEHEGRCETCGDPEGPFCEGCGSCDSCCNCAETDCDCDVCKERRGRTLCRDLDPLHELRMALTHLGFSKDEYAGIPVPLNGIPLTVNPNYTFAKVWDQINNIVMGREADAPPEVRPEDEGIVIRNVFYSHKLRCEIAILQHPDGKISWRYRPAVHSGNEMIATLYASDAWGVDQEQKALQTLGGMIKHRQFKQYLLTGMFLERSPRSGVAYIFRRLRPTIAMKAIRSDTDMESDASILCALCMHPIAYYSGSWAGAMCPTDDVIAHLSLMRGDEHMFWKRCNQHEPHMPQAGIA